MDPNTAYRKIKELMKRTSLSVQEKEELSTITEGLESWIDSGGFLPNNFSIEVLNNASMRAWN